MCRMLCLLPMLACLLTGCATLQPADDDVPGLQERIRSGEAVDVGEQVRVTTRDGGKYTVAVTAVDGDILYGREAVDDLHLHQCLEPTQLAGFLTALAVRGETPDEIAGAADALRAVLEPGARDEVSWYDGGSWHANLRDSDGLKAQPRRYIDISEAPDRVRKIYDTVLPHYLHLHDHRLQAVNG